MGNALRDGILILAFAKRPKGLVPLPFVGENIFSYVVEVKLKTSSDAIGIQVFVREKEKNYTATLLSLTLEYSY